MNTPSDTILSVDSLTIRFVHNGETTAVDAISFDLLRGETLAIVGESGSGKSVTALSSLQLLARGKSKVTGSTVFHSGDESVDLNTLSEKQIIKYRGKKIGIIFQEPMSALNPSKRCGPQVAEMLAIHTDLDKDSIKAKVVDTFAQVDLPDPERIYHSYPHELSGGQLQRIMIAMAVICEPDVLIADEPTTALDVTVQERIMELIQSLKDKIGISILFITHDLGLVKRIADRVIVMQKGHIVEQGTVKAIFENPRKAYTKGLLASRPPLHKRFKRLPTVSDFLVDGATYESITTPLISTHIEYKERHNQLEQQPTLLSVSQLKKYYPTKKDFWGRPTSLVKAVDDVTFQIKKGETLGLVGESGCGKSTLAKVIMKLIPPTAGSVTFDGKNLFSLSAKETRKLRKDFQIIFQDPYSALNPRMKIGDAILEPMSIHGIGSSKKERKENVIHLLETVGLEADHYSRYPHQFSGGQRQRICIARALGLKPKFIFCDESVSALDVSVQAQVLNLLCDLRDEYDLTYLFISHDLSVVKFISDNIMVMQSGKIVEYADAETIMHSPQNDYTKKLISSIPD